MSGRKAKQRARAESGRRLHPGHAATTPEASTEARKSVYADIHGAVSAYRSQDVGLFERHLDQLTMSPPSLVNASVVEITEHILGAVWARGWQPFDVVRATERALGPVARRWIIDLIAHQTGHYPAATIHDQWTAQLQALGADVWWTGEDEHLLLWGARERLDRGSVLRCVLEAIGAINYLPDLPMLMPPPGQARSGSQMARAETRAADRRMLDKVRALLAKAESTQFPAEAESYSAKAQELMARYNIDHALLAGQDDNPDRPVGVRITIDDPYADAKALLLQVVAEANMCRSIWTGDLGFTTVFGFGGELEVVEMLFTSLLVQGSAAMVREGSASQRNGVRTREFRQSFLQAYASRIGERLRDVAAQESANAAQHDARLLPVLASREKAVDERLREIFPESRSSTVRIRDERGWASGTAAADRATIRPGA